MSIYYNGTELSSLYYNGSPTTGFYNGIQVWPAGGPVPPGPTPTATVYSGFTYGTTGECQITLDPADGVSKNLTTVYTQIEGGNWGASYHGSNPYASPDDCLAFYAPSAGVYTLEWENWQDYSSNTSISTQTVQHRDTITSIKSIDFFGKQSWSNVWPFGAASILELPQTSANIHNGQNLTECFALFQNNPITGALIPFITAMYAACPNLTGVTNCLSGCTAASDYNEATALYPNWF